MKVAGIFCVRFMSSRYVKHNVNDYENLQKHFDQLFAFSEATATYQDPVTNEDYVYGIFTTPE